ncbi:acetyl-CoA carboxylase carboxyltransferase subunit alpha [Cruoricaptor ignavus]|uniref:Acetyl-coenzyme A carboxylase carboxyl transferase subunit alpha n=1 Tax=Cruoricaptor ignavus TaxID=1118202 RepID=A0A7M1T0W2_9FLAO|nr:acetyl-CoA carboxylase carboxyltransferase subunit alpha [Cruoricaptor ignavus]QOR73476.1 acetyl-CoA carboxylase carboxyltransferase subunit alpha [Cruoricaptor ignavus]
MEFLEFEMPVKELLEQYERCTVLSSESGVDMKAACQNIEDKIEDTKRQIYGNLTPWQTVQLSRHPNRPYTLDYVNGIADAGTFIELHGDRSFADDPAMVGGLAKVDGNSVMFIGTQKGRTTKERQHRRFGMPNPDGYRKALRLMKLAEKFKIPVITFVDTPGAYPGLEAEERGQGEAIAQNLFEMAKLRTPIITYIIGEGASGGALGVGMGNKVYMLQYTWYSVISPESCSSILWRNWNHKEEAANALKLTPKDMLKNKIIDGIVKEPLGGAHYDPQQTFQTVKASILSNIKTFSKFTPQELVEQRQEKFIEIGEFKG